MLEAGFTWLEVPLNSPRALDSISLLRERVGMRAIVGAGTVLTTEQVDSVVDAGGQVIISPNMNPSVIRRSRDRGVISLPGVATPSEAFTALEAGASGLKFYPAEMISPDILQAMCVVLPPHVVCMPVGGVSAEAQQLQRWCEAERKVLVVAAAYTVRAQSANRFGITRWPMLRHGNRLIAERSANNNLRG